MFGLHAALFLLKEPLKQEAELMLTIVSSNKEEPVKLPGK
jgi:hypothetical protein